YSSVVYLLSPSFPTRRSSDLAESAAGLAWRRQLCAADRVRQRRKPLAGASDDTKARDRDSGGNRCRTRTNHSATADRKRFATLRSEEHTSELQSHLNLVCRLL